jgi:hypothetical protein
MRFGFFDEEPVFAEHRHWLNGAAPQDGGCGAAACAMMTNPGVLLASQHVVSVSGGASSHGHLEAVADSAKRIRWGFPLRSRIFWRMNKVALSRRVIEFAAAQFELLRHR